MNLRCDDRFVQDAGWYVAAKRYEKFLQRHEGERVLFFELGVGMNTPGIIKYPFWKMTLQNPQAVYISVNAEQTYIPQGLKKQAMCIKGDIGDVLMQCRV